MRLLLAIYTVLAWCSVAMTAGTAQLSLANNGASEDQLTIVLPNLVQGICPDMTVRCVKDGNWRHPIGFIGKKRKSLARSTHIETDRSVAFCREGLRCNQCDIAANTRQCNHEFPLCDRACEAYAPIPF